MACLFIAQWLGGVTESMWLTEFTLCGVHPVQREGVGRREREWERRTFIVICY